MKKENQSLEQLILLREDLLKKINKIQETCEGSDNEENSKKILDAIDKQRFYFFKNKPKVILDIKTGAIITNLDYIDDIDKTYNLYDYSHTKEIKERIDNLELEGYTKWNFLDKEYLEELIKNKDFYLQKYFESGYWVCKSNN